MTEVTPKRVREQGNGVAALVAGLDPDSVPLPEAPSLWQAFDAIERQAAAAKTLLARRVDESGRWAAQGFRSPAEYLAAKGGTGVGRARAELAASEKVKELAATRAALQEGRLSAPQAEAIADAAAADPSAERRLLDKVERSSLHELREECARVKAAADPDPEATHARIRSERRLRSYRDGEGAWNMSARGTADDGAKVEAALAPLIDEIFGKARAEGRHEAREAYAFDALVTMADRCFAGNATAPGAVATSKRPKRTNPRHLALLRLDLEALRRGYTEGEEMCEITGIGPVPVRVARDLLGDAVLDLVITKGVGVASVTHLGRGPSAAQKIAVLWSQPACTVESCDRTFTEVDHRQPWTKLKRTELANLDRLCGHHHHLKTYDGWALVPGKGRRAMVAPDDPRHPRHPSSRPPPEGAASPLQPALLTPL